MWLADVTLHLAEWATGFSLRGAVRVGIMRVAS